MRPIEAVMAKRLLSGYAETKIQKFRSVHGKPTPGDLNEDDRQIYGNLLGVSGACTGETYWVKSDMAEVARVAGQSLFYLKLNREVLPSPDGFLVYEEVVAPETSTAVAIQGVLWYSSGSIIVICLLTPSATPVGMPLFPADNVSGGAWSPEGDIELRFDPNAAEEVGALFRTILATWMLMSQTLTTSERTYADRSEQRRCQRAGIPSDISVVKLRRRAAESDHEPLHQPVDWSHRWIVSGHWANLAVGRGRSERRLTWISPHVKGPEDKPLVVKDRVNAWIR